MTTKLLSVGPDLATRNSSPPLNDEVIRITATISVVGETEIQE